MDIVGPVLWQKNEKKKRKMRNTHCSTRKMERYTEKGGK